MARFGQGHGRSSVRPSAWLGRGHGRRRPSPHAAAARTPRRGRAARARPGSGASRPAASDQQPGAGRHADRSHRPERRGRGQAADVAAVLEDRAGADEADPRHDLGGDAASGRRADPAKPYAEMMVKRADPSATREWVRKPAGWRCSSRSNPITAPRTRPSVRRRPARARTLEAEFGASRMRPPAPPPCDLARSPAELQRPPGRDPGVERAERRGRGRARSRRSLPAAGAPAGSTRRPAASSTPIGAQSTRSRATARTSRQRGRPGSSASARPMRRIG